MALLRIRLIGGVAYEVTAESAAVVAEAVNTAAHSASGLVPLSDLCASPTGAITDVFVEPAAVVSVDER